MLNPTTKIKIRFRSIPTKVRIRVKNNVEIVIMRASVPSIVSLSLIKLITIHVNPGRDLNLSFTLHSSINNESI